MGAVALSPSLAELLVDGCTFVAAAPLHVHGDPFQGWRVPPEAPFEALERPGRLNLDTIPVVVLICVS